MASRLHSSYAHPVSRVWQSLESTLRPENLMYPLFIIDDPNEEQPINAMPGISRFGVNKALEHLEKLVPLGLNSVLLFSVTSMAKDDLGSAALHGMVFFSFFTLFLGLIFIFEQPVKFRILKTVLFIITSFQIER